METQYDVIVVGAGAAGLMAAGSSAELGSKTLLIEKMPRSGRKLRITGKGRCNLTNTADLHDFINAFGKNGKFLHQVFAQFFNDDLRDFFEQKSVPTKTERGGRVFPKSESAQDVVDALIKWCTRNGVVSMLESKVSKISFENDGNGKVSLSSGEVFVGKKIIVTTGGVSYPSTGSTGDGYKFAKDLGHKIIDPKPSLVPLETKGEIAQKLQGLSLKNVTATLFIEKKKKEELFGEMIFTHFGLSGPIILTLSKYVAEALSARKKVYIKIDLKPALDEQTLDSRILRELQQHGRQKFKKVLKTLLPLKLIDVCCEILKLDGDKKANQIDIKDRNNLNLWLKNFRFEIKKCRPVEEAIITSGGVDLREINPKTMESKIVNNLYFAGEILDLAGDTGGYNLQEAFSTGRAAGIAAAGGK